MQTFESVVSRFWWTLLLRGLVAIAFGVLTLIWPGVTLSALILLFGFYALADGIAGIALGVKEWGDHDRWWSPLLGGMVSVAAGLLTFFMPGVTTVVLLSIIGFWAIVRGAADIMAAVRLRDMIEGEWLLALGGVLSIGFGVLMLARPAVGALAVVMWIGVFAIAMGAVLVALGFRVRGAVPAHA